MSKWNNVMVVMSIVGSIVAAPGIAAADHWGAFKDDGCVSSMDHVRKFSSILWGIPWGASWEAACAKMPADVGGKHFEAPSRCVNFGPGINMWGEFLVPDDSCPCKRVCETKPRRKFGWNCNAVGECGFGGYIDVDLECRNACGSP